jgi:hypothetical protein
VHRRADQQPSVHDRPRPTSAITTTLCAPLVQQTDGELIPQLIDQDAQPRVMLALLHGLREMGAHDVLDALCTITVEPS